MIIYFKDNANKFKSFLESLETTNNKEVIDVVKEGFDAFIFFEQELSNVSPVTPYSMVAGEPMGSYNNIMKQIPSSIGAAGGSSDSNRNSNYNSEMSLPDVHRDQVDETKNEWENAPKFNKFVKQPSKFIKTVIDKAQEHIPVRDNYIKTQPNFYANFHLGMYGEDTPYPPF